MYPEKFEELIHAFTKLPGVGYKTAERYAFTYLNWDDDTKAQFIEAVENAQNGIKRCTVCGNLSDGDKCAICSDVNRNRNIICIVQNPKDISAIESMQEYNGVYHVLNGLINTSKGILPENLNIDSLIKRVDESVEEVIIATDPTMEGETTALYLQKLLGDTTHVTRLAHGIPVGGHLDYTDSMTLLKAFENRK
ncbi:MAG: recombination protein RecR [Faecalicoccus sp.]|nr:recombination protein RecR [Faecalicoccus sp.]